MAISRTELAKLLNGVDNQEDIINYVMAENGKQINALRAENEELKSKISLETKKVNDKEKEFNDFKESVKDFETIKKQNEELNSKIKEFEKLESDKKFIDELDNAGVDEKYKEFVFSKLTPTENETIENYKTRVNDYLEKNNQFKTENYQKIHTQLEVDGNAPDFNKMSDEEYINYKSSLRNKN